jgi:hypothetical protein
MSVGVGCMACEFPPEKSGPEKKGRFNELLVDEELYHAFEDFLKSEFAEENLQFYKDSGKFEQLASSTETTVSAEDVRSLALALASKYLGYELFTNVSLHFTLKPSDFLPLGRPARRFIFGSHHSLDRRRRPLFVTFHSHGRRERSYLTYLSPELVPKASC